VHCTRKLEVPLKLQKELLIKKKKLLLHIKKPNHSGGKEEEIKKREDACVRTPKFFLGL